MFLYQILINILNIINFNIIIAYTKSFEIFPKNNALATISDCFALNL